METRRVSFYYDEDGSLVLKARLPAVSGAMLVKALQAAMKDIPTCEVADRGVEVTLGPQLRRADALGLVAEAYLRRRAAAAHNADCHQLVVHVDAEALASRSAGGCYIEEGPTLAVETVRRLGCDTSTIRILEDENGEPLDVGRKTRRVPAAIRRALRARDTGCCFPGCTFKHYLDAHHIEHWIDGGETRLDNLLSLCRWHHRAVRGDILAGIASGPPG